MRVFSNSSTRASFMKKLQQLLEDDYEDFESLENVEKSSYVATGFLEATRKVRDATIETGSPACDV